MLHRGYAHADPQDCGESRPLTPPVRAMKRVLLLLPAIAGLALSVPARAADESYLFAYFTGNGVDGLHFLRSENGLAWTKVQGGKSFLRPEIDADRLMRDPCIFQGPDGEFRLVWTTSWKSRNIGYAHSADLIHWSKEELLPVMAQEPTALNAWAPELTYDPGRHHYLIFWASTIPGRFPETERTGDPAVAGAAVYNHRIYGTTTADFVSYGPTRLIYDGGFNAIDATMARDGDGWLMFIKDETLRPTPQKNIRLVRAPSPEGPFAERSAPITGPGYWAEGPTSIKIDGAWYVYVDRYREHRFGAVRSTDLVHWEDVTSQLAIPKETKHGTVFRVPRAVADRLEAAP